MSILNQIIRLGCLLIILTLLDPLFLWEYVPCWLTVCGPFAPLVFLYYNTNPVAPGIGLVMEWCLFPIHYYLPTHSFFIILGLYSFADCLNELCILSLVYDHIFRLLFYRCIVVSEGFSPCLMNYRRI